MRRIALLLALCLLLSSLPTVALTEGIDAQAVVAVTADAVEETVDAADGLLSDAPEETVLALDEAPAREAETPEDDASEETLANALGLDMDDEAADARANEPHVDPLGPVLAANEVTLGVGEKFDLAPALPEGQTGEIALSSSDDAVVAVRQDGLITAVGVGTAVVTAALSEETYTECAVEVLLAPDEVAFEVSELTMGKGETIDAPAVVLGSAPESFAGAYTVTSGNPKIVKVTAAGKLKALKLGSTTITVTTYNGKKADCEVSVIKAPGKVTASAEKDVLGVGETSRINYAIPEETAGHATFESEAPGIVQVDEATGEITGVAVGTTRVCVKTFNGKKTYVSVTVVPAPQSLAFSVGSVRLGVGMRLAIQAETDKGAGGEIAYRVGKKAVATYASGKLKGVKAGKTVLEARTYNGLVAQCDVEVVAAPKKVTLPYKTVTIGVKQSLRLSPSVGNSASTYTYTTSSRQIAKVNASGVVTGVKQGTATVTVKTYNNKSVKLKVKVVKAPASLTLSTDDMELAVDETLKLGYTLPKNTAASVTFTSSDPDVATVEADTGRVRGVAPGAATITATTHNGKKAQATVVVFSKPEWIALPYESMEIAEAQTFALDVELSPGSRSPLRFASDDKGVATVSQDGIVTGVKQGEATVTVHTNAEGVSATVLVKVLPAPDSVKLGKSKLTLNVGETTQLNPVIPEGTLTEFTYTSSDEAVATVSEDGMVATHAKGKATLTVTTHNSLTATLKLTVLDPWYPDAVTITNIPGFMQVGESLQLEWNTEPEGAVADLQWSSTNEEVAFVDADGILWAVGYGYAQITAVSARNPSIEISFTVGVETDSVTLEIPARITGIGGIEANLQKIKAIRSSAYKQIELLKDGGVITAADANKRKSIVENAFRDYAFPWMTPTKQKYWRAANSEGGVKDFKPNQVYYGMPYISGSGKNREYNVPKALKEKRFVDSGEGYYLLNQDNLLKGKYCGNDCSCFVDAAIWGTGTSRSNDRTGEIAKNSAYKTINSYNSLRTGDLICKGGSHVVMFLYFVNADKSKIMIIENGGIEPGTNTVHCMVMNVSWYTSRGYKIRRLRTLG